MRNVKPHPLCSVICSVPWMDFADKKEKQNSKCNQPLWFGPVNHVLKVVHNKQIVSVQPFFPPTTFCRSLSTQILTEEIQTVFPRLPSHGTHPVPQRQGQNVAFRTTGQSRPLQSLLVSAAGTSGLMLEFIGSSLRRECSSSQTASSPGSSLDLPGLWLGLSIRAPVLYIV